MRFELSKPMAGFTSLIFGDNAVHGISYVNPYVVEELIDWLEHVIENRPHIIELDREGKYSLLIYTGNNIQDILLTGSQLTKERYVTFIHYNHGQDDMREMVETFCNSIRANINEWVLWYEPETGADADRLEEFLLTRLSELEHKEKEARECFL